MGVSVMVYSRLGDLLRTRNLTVSDLQRQIAARFGRTVDARTLDRLVRAEIAEDFKRRLAWWEEVQADPARLQALVDEALERRRERVSG